MSDLNLKSLMDVNFLEYASYVIKERAIPDIDDGLKPVQRRILHTLFEIDDGKFHKVANVVGHTMRYHPHGDASIEDALVNIAQKNYFIEQQGNFGNVITGDPASAARYIECRVSSLAKECMYFPEITEYVESYDGRNKEPVKFPSKLPYLLISGVEGIAVGLSTKILPHNFVELLESQIKILRGRDFEIYPDFIQGGLVDVSLYERGKGKVKVRAKIDIVDNKTLVIREIPFGTNTESLIESIEEAIEKGKLKITSINDFTTENVEIELKVGHGVTAQEILPRLYLYSDCEMSINSNIVVIKENMPVEANVNEILTHNTNKLVTILEKELNVKLEKLQIKLHERMLTKIFIKEKLYLIIETADSPEELELILTDAFIPYQDQFSREITSNDLDKLLSIPIKKISRFDIQKTLDEIKEIQKEISLTENDLLNITTYTIKFLKDMISKYGDKFPRRTKIDTFENIDVNRVAVQDIKVGYDESTNYIGTDVKGGDIIQFSSFDKLLMYFDNGDYKIINIPEKLFLENKVLYHDRQTALKTVSVVYFEPNENIYYMKRFVVSKFILDKVYRFIPDGCKLEFFSTSENPIIKVDYAFQKRAKITTEYIHLGRLTVKSVTSIGNQLATRPVTSISEVNDENIISLFEKESEEVMRLKPPSDEQPGLFELTSATEEKIEGNN